MTARSTGLTPTPGSDPGSAAHAGAEDRAEKHRYAAMLGARLHAIRTAAELTDDDVAERAGIGLPAYRTLEAGEPAALRQLTADTVGRLAEILGTDPVHLMGGPNPTT